MPDRNRRERILALAAQLFAEKGVAATTVRDIGTAAGILSGSLYYHFDSKESIVKDIVRGYLERLIAKYDEVIASTTDPKERFDGLVVASFESIVSDHHACEIYQNDYKALHALDNFAELAALTKRFQRAWMDTIELGVSRGVFRSDVDPTLFYRFARDAIWFSVRWRRRASDTPARLAETASKILLDGFAEPLPRTRSRSRAARQRA